MKFAFFMVSLICALALSALAFIMATGKIPFRPPPQQTEKTEEREQAMTDMMSTNMAAVQNLVAALKQEREKVRQKEIELEDDRDTETLKIKIETLEALKDGIENGLVDLKKEMTIIEADERKNLKSLADVYAKMESENAANVLEKMDPDRAAMILYLMNDRNAAAVLDAVAAKGEESQELARKWADIIRKLKNNAGKEEAQE